MTCKAYHGSSKGDLILNQVVPDIVDLYSKNWGSDQQFELRIFVQCGWGKYKQLSIPSGPCIKQNKTNKKKTLQIPTGPWGYPIPRRIMRCFKLVVSFRLVTYCRIGKAGFLQPKDSNHQQEKTLKIGGIPGSFCR